ncbi:MAG TPA: carboxypeptidase regulatory-like domain-containing protein, partial [Candidatus Dormibacteraeota bacterium]|nr:carboxypeptidase regulatory-like domain-containing protein [Candidatus Dormibacteraeota bacterium]
MRFAAVSALLLCGALASVAVPLPVLATTTIQGHMTDTDTGGPAAGVVIKVCAASGCAGSVGQTDSNGNYEIDNAPPGGAWSLVTFPTDACTAGEYARAHENVTIPPDGVLNPPDITVTRQKATIEGVVRDSQNRPAAGVNVTAENSEQGGDGFNYANTGADGSYAIPCLPIGRGYFLTANPPRTAGLGQQMDSPF